MLKIRRDELKKALELAEKEGQEYISLSCREYDTAVKVSFTDRYSRQVEIQVYEDRIGMKPTVKRVEEL